VYSWRVLKNINPCSRQPITPNPTDFFQGCITAEELKFVLTHLPGKVTYKEIDEMIRTVDENGDGKINYQEFRVMIGAKPNLTAARAAQKAAETKPGTGTTGTGTTSTTTTTTLTMAAMTNALGNNTTTTTTPASAIKK
jgi:hypothetical protein